MKAIVATPKKIKSIFQDTYVIPDFQRPYSWEEEQCLTLLNDIIDYFEEKGNTSDDEYYLGNIVFYCEKGKYNVIDGQQRLTTLLLLLKALYSKAAIAKALEECIKQKDTLTGELINKMKIESNVIEEDYNELQDIILNDNFVGDSRFKKNYNKLLERLSEWMRNRSSDEINNFILTVLNNVGMLPIECSSLDDALVIFNTVNNRGMPLSDADIFKALMIKEGTANDSKKRKEFVNRWNALNEDEYIEGYFRILMHMIRAENNVIDREIGLRKFYEKDSHNNLKPYENVLLSLEKIKYFDDEYPITSRMKNLWSVIYWEKPNDYACYPIFAYWYKYAEFHEEDGENIWKLPADKMDEFEKLLEATIKYYFVNAIAYNTVNKVKDTTYKVCAAIMHDKNYLQFYTENYSVAYDIFKQKIELYEYGKCRKGLVYLLAILNENQDQEALYNVDKKDLEHILPQKGGYNNYNGWSEQEYKEKLNTLGNFVLFEKPKNIRASNDFFAKKKKEYETSDIQEVKDLLKLSDWTYRECEEREKQKENEILEFFKMS